VSIPDKGGFSLITPAKKTRAYSGITADEIF